MKHHDSTAEKLTAEGFSNDERFAYPGRELEAMAEASNYHRWILGIFKPYLGHNIVEVGAGLGSFSELILEHRNCESLSLVEPSDGMYQQLVARARRLKTTTRIATYHGTFVEVASLIKSETTPDSIIYVNVLEHIADDELELNTISQTLPQGGRAFFFVPALPWLYGTLDERVGHFRRYTKGELEERLRRAGFNIASSRYFDVSGIVPWWVMYCLLKSAKMSSRSVRFYDRLIVPAARRVESLVPPPIGKNVIVIAEKR
jgi:SAM-dependent methyltransferase